jgi:hypothetical protein
LLLKHLGASEDATSKMPRVWFPNQGAKQNVRRLLQMTYPKLAHRHSQQLNELHKHYKWHGDTLANLVPHKTRYRIFIYVHFTTDTLPGAEFSETQEMRLYNVPE